MKYLIDQSICVVGLGYVGLTLATVMAQVNFKVYGVEIRTHVVEDLKKGIPHFFEPGLKDILKTTVSAGTLKLSQHIPEDCPATVFIITVGTPLDDDGIPRMDMISNVASEVSANLKDGDLVILRSTVQLGTTRNIVKPILDNSGKKYDIAFCPERTLEGTAIQELRTLPQIVGAQDPNVGLRASQIFHMLTPTIVCVESMETAEMVKLVDNTARDVIFGYANEVARICDTIGLDGNEVIRSALLGYPRHKLAFPGPVGGPCLSKDSYVLAEGLKPYGIEPEIIMAARRVNERQPDETMSQLKGFMQSLPHFPENCRVSFLGIAFKGRPSTNDTRNTMAIPIAQAVRRHMGIIEITSYDPFVSIDEQKALGFSPVSDLSEAFRDKDLIVICNNHPVFSGMSLEHLTAGMHDPGLVYDFWGLHNPRKILLPDQITYISLGSGGFKSTKIED